MSRRIKRAISILLAVIMVVTYMPATAFAGSSYDFSGINLSWRNDGLGYYRYSRIKAEEVWYLCQHYYNDELISYAMCNGNEFGYGVWQTIPASKMKEPGKYKLVLSVFSSYNDLDEFERGNLSKKPLYQTSITKDYTAAKRIQTPTELMWNSDKKTVSWKAVDNAVAYLVDAKKIYKDGHTEDITFDSFPCEFGDDGVSTKNGRVYVNLSEFIEMYSHDPITYSPDVKDVVFDVIAVPDNSGEYFVSKTSEKCYFSEQNSSDNSTEISLKDCTISSVKKDYTYTGKAIKLSVQIIDPNGYQLVEGQDYKITYKNNVAVGKGTANIKGIGDYTDSIPVTMTIKPKTPSLISLSKGAAKFTAKWKKVSNVTGYQIRYSKSSGMTNAKTLTVKATATKKTVSGLDGNKKYYVQVRAYKTINGKKYYSAWSTKKSITVAPKYSSTTVKNAYMKYLKNQIQKGKYKGQYSDDVYYAFHDMNNDGIKEMLVHSDLGNNEIFSYKNGKVMRVYREWMSGAFVTMKDSSDLVFRMRNRTGNIITTNYQRFSFNGQRIKNDEWYSSVCAKEEDWTRFQKFEKRLSKEIKYVKFKVH